MHLMKILCRIVGLILTAQYVAPASANVAASDYTTLEVRNLKMSWPDDFKINKSTGLSASATIGPDSTKVPDKDRGAFDVQFTAEGASDCQISGENIRISISTFWDRTNLFDIADNKLSLTDGTKQTISYTKAEANKVTGMLQTYTWYLKEFEMKNIRLNCSIVTDNNPTFYLKINGHLVDLNQKPIKHERYASVKVPKKIDITSEPGKCLDLELWKERSGDPLAEVKGPETIELVHKQPEMSSPTDKLPPLTVTQESGSEYKLCTGNNAGVFEGTATVRLLLK